MTLGAATRRVVVALVTVGLALVVPAGAAGADPARPTDYRSSVTGSSPTLPDGVTVRVVGGDAFLELHVDGHEVVVPDYAAGADDPAPYLRFSPDGTVERNERAVATTANDTRYGTARTDAVDADAEPEWVEVASDGRYAWHDHRIHWMSPTAPTAVAADGTVDLGGPDGGWEVPIVVDGEPTTISGTLVLEDPPSPWPWALVGVVVAAAVVALARRAAAPLAPALAAGVATVALATSIATWRAVPADAGGSPVPVAVCAITLVAAVAAAVLRSRAGLGATALAAAGLVGWGATRASVLTHAVLPTTLPLLDRFATAAALGAGIGLAVGLVWPPSRSTAPEVPLADEVAGVAGTS